MDVKPRDRSGTVPRREGGAGPPIFIQGIMPRSGTNFLADLLSLHPDCAQPAPIWENYLVHYFEVLETYVDRTVRHWDPDWGVGREEQEEFLRRLGDGMLRFLRDRIPGGKRLVTKTPRVDNLPSLFRLFPSIQVIVVVRDGRSVVESGVRTFGWDYEDAMRKWRQAADVIDAFERTGPDAGRYRRVRYEDLCTEPESQLRDLLLFLGLDTGRYDFQGAADLPVKGSSQLAEREGEVHWAPVSKTEDFDSLRRWSSWSPRLHARFNWIAEEESRRLGYSLEEPPGGELRWRTWNAIRDARRKGVGVLHAARRDTRRVIGALRARIVP